MLQDLSPSQVEQAFQWLDSQVKSSPPQALKELNQLEWFLLDRMLQQLKQEQQNSPRQ